MSSALVTLQVDASDERIGQRIAQEYLGSAPRVAAQAGAASADRTLTRLNTFKAGDEVCIGICMAAIHASAHYQEVLALPAPAVRLCLASKTH